MKRILSALLMMFTMNVAAKAIPSYENAISYPETQDYVEALVEDLKRPASCLLNGKRLPFTEVQTVFKVTIGDRLRLLLDKKNDLAKLYFIEEWNPVLLIATQHEGSDKTKLYDELRFNLSEDEKTVRSIDFDQFIVTKVKVNEGTLRNPVVVIKEELKPKMNIRCVL